MTRASAAIDHLLALDLQRHSHEGLLERAWAVRRNLTICDAHVLALAEALDATLVTLRSVPAIARSWNEGASLKSSTRELPRKGEQAVIGARRRA